MTGNQVFCIVGTPRSGTSLIAGAVRASGVYWGEDKDILPASETMNSEGFHEHLQLETFHYDLITSGLNRYGWFHAKPLPDHWWKAETLDLYKGKLRKIIEANFAGAPAWGWKDPRGTLLLPLWLEVLNEMGMTAHVIIPFRNPIDVARSMARLWRLPPDQSLRLWLYYMLAIKDSVRGVPHLFVHYDHFLENPRAGAEALFAFIGDNARPQMIDEIPKLVRPGMRHSQSDEAILRSAVDPSLASLFEECLGRTVGDQGPIQTLDDYRQISRLADFDRADYAPQWIDSSLFCDSGNGLRNPADYVMRLIPFAADGGFDEIYVFPAPGPKRLLFSPCDKGFHCRCRINAWVGEIPCDVSSCQAAGQADGWDVFAPGTQPTYELIGNFAKATQVRIKGQIEVQRARLGDLAKITGQS